MTEDYFEGYDKWPDFIQTYIFPGGELASDQLFIDEANKLSEYLKNNSNIDLAFEINDDGNLLFSKYSIIFLCGNSYLKL